MFGRLASGFFSKIALLCLCFVCACHQPDGWKWYYPTPVLLTVHNADYQKSDYQKGYNAGCQTSISEVGEGISRAVPIDIDGWKMTGKSPNGGKHEQIKRAPAYFKGWFDGLEFCSYYADFAIT